MRHNKNKLKKIKIKFVQAKKRSRDCNKMGHTRHTGRVGTEGRRRGRGSGVHNGQSKTLQTQISAEICTHQRGNDVLVIASMIHTKEAPDTSEGEGAARGGRDGSSEGGGGKGEH